MALMGSEMSPYRRRILLLRGEDLIRRMEADVAEYDRWVDQNTRLLASFSWAQRYEGAKKLVEEAGGDMKKAHDVWFLSMKDRLAPSVDRARSRIDKVRTIMGSVRST
jgi:hypothetical protein